MLKVDKLKEIIKNIFLAVSIIIDIFLIVFGGAYLYDFFSLGVDFTTYKNVAIPTNTPIKATADVPNNWRFQTKDGWVSITDVNTDELVAIQIYERRLVMVNGSHKPDQYIFNTDIQYDIVNQEKYELLRGSSNGAVHKFKDEDTELFCISILVGDYHNDDGTNYVIWVRLMVVGEVSEKQLKHITDSILTGGEIINFYPDDSTYN